MVGGGFNNVERQDFKLLQVITSLKTCLDDIKDNQERLFKYIEEQEEINGLRKLDNEKVNKKTHRKKSRIK